MKRYSKWLLAFGVSFLAAGGCSSRGQEETPELVASIGERLQGTGIKAERTSFNSWNTGYNMQFTVTNTGTQTTTNWEVDVVVSSSTVTDTSNAHATQNGNQVTFRSNGNTSALAPNSSVLVYFAGTWTSTARGEPQIQAVRRNVASGGTGGTGGTTGSTSKGGTSSGGAVAGGATGIIGSGGTGGGVGGTNVALGKPAAASSELLPNNPASYGNDAGPNTDWCAGATGAGASWSVDLGGSYNLTGSSITWPAALAGYRYLIEASDSGTAYWSVVDKRSSNGSAAQTQPDSFSTSAQFVRLTVTTLPSSLPRVCLRDFQLYGSSSSNGSGGSTSTMPPSGGANTTAEKLSIGQVTCERGIWPEIWTQPPRPDSSSTSTELVPI